MMVGIEMDYNMENLTMWAIVYNIVFGCLCTLGTKYLNKMRSFKYIKQFIKVFSDSISQQNVFIRRYAWSITWNQSIVQQLTSEGNFLSLLRKASPMGLMASTICSWSLTRSTK